MITDPDPPVTPALLLDLEDGCPNAYTVGVLVRAYREEKGLPEPPEEGEPVEMTQPPRTLSDELRHLRDTGLTDLASDDLLTRAADALDSPRSTP